MVCPKCHSENVNVQIVNETQLEQQHRGLFYWVFIGWWWIPIKWLFLTVPALIISIFKPKKYKTKNKQKSMCACQNCGHIWEIKA